MLPKWSWIVSAIVLMSATLPPINTDQLTELVERQLDDIHNQYIDRAYASYTASSFRDATSLKNFEEVLKQNTILTNNKKFVLSGAFFEGDKGTIKGFLISRQGESFEIIYDLNYEDKEWKIAAIQLLPSNSTL